MATEGQKDVGCSLVDVGDLILEDTDLYPYYRGIVVSFGMIMIVDWNECEVRLHNLLDGKLLAISHRLESFVSGICLINDMEIYVILEKDQIVNMSAQYTGETCTIVRGKTLDVKGGLDEYHGIAKFKDDVVVCGRQHDTICWCIVSINDGHVDTINQICKGEWIMLGQSYLTTNNNLIYISCYAGRPDSPDNGVYAYDILSPSKQTYIYKHEDLDYPRAITVDTRGFIFVCNHRETACIHHLTDKCELVSIYREGIPSLPMAIFWDQQHRHLYVTSFESNVITRYKPEYRDTAAIPAEILRMNDRSIYLFKEAMKAGEAKVYNIRVMVVGHFGVGKTTLVKRLLGENVNIRERQSTEGITVHAHCCSVSGDTLKWTLNEGDSEQDLRLQRLAKVLNDEYQKRNSTDKIEEQVEIIYQREKKGHAGDKYINVDHALHLQNVDQNIPFSSASDEVPSNEMNEVDVKDVESATGKIGDDPAIEILKLLRLKADKLKQQTNENIPLTMVDFAGQYAFYTTHQTFLTERAIYLLVSNISEHVTDPVEDDCYFDMEGIKLCKVYELVEVWLNSIHSCAPFPEADIPPVILVGTHVDQIPQDSRDEICKNYFRQIRCEYLGEKPIIVHLADEDFAIDNTVIDQKLEELKEKIVQLASKQPYWGEAIPARWLPLEENMMSLKAAGIKVIPYSLLEKMNQEETVKIESREELELFLKFQHDIGNILYFGTEELKGHIMLDPQWLIYALRTIITAENFVLKKMKTPAIIEKWCEFKKTGKLTSELIDVIWTKENYPDCHGNKDLILCLMEKLNIVARPRSFSKDGYEAKEENYFLAPCMLRQKTPMEIICPQPHHQMESSSVLCYVFKEKFLPSPIFHRLLASCIAHWPIATRKKENLIFCGCCVFRLIQNHKLTLHFREYVIFVRITRKGISDKTLSSKLCIEVREFITAMLFKIIGYMGQNLKFEHYIQCPECNGDSVNGLIPVSQLKENAEVECEFHDSILESYELLKFWFKDVTEAKKKHNELFVVLDDLITEDLFKKIKRMARTYLDPKTVEKAQDMDTMLSYLEESDVIGVGKYDKLIEMITLAGGIGGGIIQIINKTAKDIEDIMQNRIPCQEQMETSSLDSDTSNQDSIHPNSGTKGQKRRSFSDLGEPARKRNRSKPQETHGSTSMGEIPTEAMKKHNELFVVLDDLITEDLFKKIKRMARTYLGPKPVEKVQDMDKLMSGLEENDVIGVGKYDKLIEIIKLAGGVGGGIIQIINKTAKDIEDIMQTRIPSQEQMETSSLDAHASSQDSIHPRPCPEYGEESSVVPEDHITQAPINLANLFHALTTATVDVPPHLTARSTHK